MPATVPSDRRDALTFVSGRRRGARRRGISPSRGQAGKLLNGEFSGVIKNSFAIVDGAVGPALSEVMITGNIARMLKDIVGLSRERIDPGALRLPWLRIGNLHFS